MFYKGHKNRDRKIRPNEIDNTSSSKTEDESQYSDLSEPNPNTTDNSDF